MKLIGTEEECHRLNGSKQEIQNTNIEAAPPKIKYNDEE